MRQKKLRQVVHAVALYGLAALVVLSVPFSAAYADESPDTQGTIAQPDESTVATPPSTELASPQVSEPIKSDGPRNSSSRESLEDWRARKEAREQAQAAANSAATPQTSSDPSIALVQPDGAVAAAADNSTTKSSVNAATAASVSNIIDSLAKSGNADVIKNTLAGNASTGDTTATATVINNINSIVTNQNNKDVATFVTNVMGDTSGDIILQPMLLKAMLEANSTQPTNQTQSANTTSAQNDINLTAKSGDASVIANTQAGNATTGSANTVADVVNIVNSMVSANQSFIGTINIYGNLNGDILIAPDFIPQMIANNKDVTTVDTPSSVEVNSNNTDSIINNVALAAQSGQALVDKNTQAGNATTGDANTNLVIFNLTGHDVVASNSLLVFVNVLGNWVGVIVDAPTGATAAAIGSGVTSNNVSDAQPSMVVDVDNNTQLVNNINLASTSGNATVARNTIAGNATTGNATASANILNMSRSQLSLGGWFGVLFINVFGTWTGSFGIDTSAGTIATVSNSDNSTAPPAVIRFVPRSTGGSNSRSISRLAVVSPNHSNQIIEANSITPAEYQTGNGLATYNDQVPEVLGQMATKGHPVNMPLLVVSILLISGSAFGIRRLLA